MTAGPEIPAQTITMSSDAFDEELKQRLEKALSGFRVYRSAYYVRLQHLPCLEVLLTTPETTLLELTGRALNHECEAEPR